MRKIPEAELDHMLEVIAQFPDGASLEDISSKLTFSLARRTLQYRLSSLVKAGRIILKGNTRAGVYILAERESKIVKPLANDRILLSTAAELIQSEVARPLQARKPVSYSRAFLDAYSPNRTFYLSESMRKHLLQLGKTDGDRPAGTHARVIFNRLLIDLSWNSSRLEGNTYSLLETERLIALGEAAVGKNSEETQMILNHKTAIEFLVESANDREIRRHTILNLHSLLADNLLISQACGSLRRIAVGIGGSVYKPLDIPQLVHECFEKIIHLANQIQDPFEQAFFLMVQLPYLQPFEDVNKRVSRLAANIPLIQENLCPLSFVGVAEQSYINGLLGVYELNRIELLSEVFIWAYERSCALYSTARKTLGEPDPFRQKYRDAVYEVVSEIVRNNLDKNHAVAFIKRRMVELLPIQDQSRFMEVVETELMSLHSGNIARYRLRPSEFDTWQLTWK
jgi:hypothetical protein